MFIHRLMALSLIATTAVFTSTAFAGDAAKGKKVFNKCKACHTVKAGKNKVGPSLAGIVGKKAGTVKGYKKYKGLKGADWSWNEAELNGYLANPKKYLKGKTGKKSAMVLKLKKKKDRDNVIAYLKAN